MMAKKSNFKQLSLGFEIYLKNKLLQLRLGEGQVAESERILKQDSSVKTYLGEHPPSLGLKAGAFADVGTLILTDQRLVYINDGKST